MDGGAWWAAVHGVAKSRTRLSDFTYFTLLYSAAEEEAERVCSSEVWIRPLVRELRSHRP